MPRPRVRHARAALCLLLLAALGCESAVDRRPHAIVLITVDTARADHFDWDDPATLPATKRAFATGMRFDQAVAVSPVTGPSHASMLTGLTPLQHRLLSNPLPLRPGVVTLAEHLQEAGYRTAAFTSTSLLSAGRGFDQGYAHYQFRPDRSYVGRNYERVAWHTTDDALEWLRENDDQPFHLWLHYFDAHAPYDPPGPFRPRGFEELERDPDARPTVERLQAIADAGEIDAQRRAWYRALYAGELASLDAELARVFAYLDGREYAPRVVLALAGDHGEELGDHGAYFEHGSSLYDGVMRVPLALRGSGVPARRVAEQVSHAAVAATLLELAGLEVPAGVEPSLLAARADAQPARLLIKEPHPFVKPWGAAVRQPPWKYLYWEDGRESLHHLGEDPGERRDVAAAEPERTRRMRERIEQEIVPALGSREAPTLDDETRAMLHALGYADLPGR